MLTDILQTILKQIETEIKKENLSQKKLDKDTLINFLSQIEPLFKQPDQTKVKTETKESVEEEPEMKSVATPQMIHSFKERINETFVHNTSKEKYILLDIVNTETTNSDKFPVMAIYFDKKSKTKWSRPLVDFVKKFKQVF